MRVTGLVPRAERGELIFFLRFARVGGKLYGVNPRTLLRLLVGITYSLSRLHRAEGVHRDDVEFS